MRRVGLVLLALTVVVPARAQEGVFLTEAEAPGAVFPDADRVERREIESTPAIRDAVSERLEGAAPSTWEERYVVFAAFRGDVPLGRAFVVEEVGKHRPITFVVGVRPDGSIADTAVMTYREAYGGEIRSPRFVAQYRGRPANDPLRPYEDIKNIAGATLSVEAASRAVRKARALSVVLPGLP